MSVCFYPIQTLPDDNRSRIIRKEDVDQKEVAFIAGGNHEGIFVMQQKTDFEELPYDFKQTLSRNVNLLKTKETRKTEQIFKFYFNKSVSADDYEKLSKEYIEALEMNALNDNGVFLLRACDAMKKIKEIDMIDLQIRSYMIDEVVENNNGKENISEPDADANGVGEGAQVRGEEVMENVEIGNGVNVGQDETAGLGMDESKNFENEQEKNQVEDKKVELLDAAEDEEREIVDDVEKVEKLDELEEVKNENGEPETLDDGTNNVEELQIVETVKDEEVQTINDGENCVVETTDAKSLVGEDVDHGQPGIETLEYQKQLEDKVELQTDDSKTNDMVYAADEVVLDFESEKAQESDQNGEETILKPIPDNMEELTSEVDNVVSEEANLEAQKTGEISDEEDGTVPDVMETRDSDEVLEKLAEIADAKEIEISPETLETDDAEILKAIEAQKQAELEEKQRAIFKQNCLKTIQDYLERSYPNSLTMKAIMELLQSTDSDLIKDLLKELEDAKIIATVGPNEFIRSENSLIQSSKFQNINQHLKPTIAIITTLFMEKVAIEALLENPYVEHEYKNTNDSHVYTVGKFGKHVIVLTKLSANIDSRKAKISANSSTTRLLGHFPGVEHVFILGTGRTVDQDKVQVGDVVVSQSDQGKTYCWAEILQEHEDDDGKLNVECYTPKRNVLAKIANKFSDEDYGFWINQYDILSQKVDIPVSRNPSVVPTGFVCHLGQVGTFSRVWQQYNQRNDKFYSENPETAHGRGIDLRHKMYQFQIQFIQENDIVAMDDGYDSVIAALEGSCIDSWSIILGIFHNDEHEKYSAVAKAASFIKTAIQKM